MTITGFCVAAVLVLAVAQAIVTIVYVHRLTACRQFSAPKNGWPRTLVVLSLRGGDAGLERCLNGLVSQDYSPYQIKIIIDHPTDPAAEIVQQWQERESRVPVSVEYLESPSEFATLKCSAVRQAVHDLDDDIQVVVIVDGDAIAYPNWLCDLVAPLAQPGIGAVTGNRWYFPDDASLGGWCRFIYNGLALPAMDALTLTWGGSLAVKRAVIESEVFLESLKHASCEDQSVRDGLHSLGLRCHFNPRVILLNSEGCTAGSCLSFVFRQLLWTRLYHPAWTMIFAHALGSYLLLALTFVLAVAGVFYPSSFQDGAMLWCAIGVYTATVVASVVSIDSAVRSVALRWQGADAYLPLAMKLKTVALATWAAPTTLLLYTVAIVKAAVASKVVWRGVEYAIQSAGRLRVVTYQPLASQSGESLGHSCSRV